MEFVPCAPFDANQAQRAFWESLKVAFAHDEGISIYRYPVFRPDGKILREPDVVFAHRKAGIWIFEVKGCRIGNLDHIRGHVWTMQNWHSESETPFAQATAQMFAVQGIVQRQSSLHVALLEHRIEFHAGVVLPFVSEVEWQERLLHEQFGGLVLFSETMRGESLGAKIAARAKPPTHLSDAEWQGLLRALGGTIPAKEPRPIPAGTPPTDARRVINHIEAAFKPLDDQQRDVAFQIPPGPQRLRGLAGSGKTLLLAWRAARIHAAHPDWDIAFVFFTKALYQQVRNLILRCYREMTDVKEPDWNKLHVLHAWGSAQGNGFHSRTCLFHGLRPLAAQGGEIAAQFHQICEQL